MKVLRNSLILALLSSAPALAVPIPADLAGSYQALLYSQDLDAGSPSGLVTLAVTTKGAVTGKLTTAENKTYPFKATLDYTAANTLLEDFPLGTASAPVITISRGKNVPAWSLTLRLQDFTENDTLEVVLNQDETTFGSTDNGFKQITFAKGALPYAAAGIYTTAFVPVSPGEGEPSGSGYAVTSIDAKGVLKLVGKTADGTAFTTTLPAGPDQRYVAFLNPYKRANSMLAGKIQLTEIGEGGSGFHMIPSATPADFKWTKSSLLPKTTDKSYREGFDLDLAVSMEQWTIPGKGETLAQVLGTQDLQFDFDILGAGLNFHSDYPGMLPKKLTIDAKNALVPVFGDVFAPVDAKEWAKYWSAKVDPKTGVYKGTLTVTELSGSNALIDDSVLDNADPNNPPVATPLKFIKRVITFEGVLFNSDNNEAPLAQGYFLIPPVNAKTSTTKAGTTALGGDLEELFTGAPDLEGVRPGTAGTYTTTLVTEIKPLDFSQLTGGVDGFSIGATPPMKGIPGEGASITFSIAPDLSSLTFNGRKIPLVGDQRKFNVALVFSDASSTKIKNTLTVVVYLDPVSGQVAGLGAMYVQLLPTSITFPTTVVPGFGTIKGRTVRGFVPGVAWYVENSTPVKIH
ncbi:MAG TPA: hypothetical protein DCP71_14775 [Verrucomicrobiales bacterium]|nr:hypothetical protein [Verrucomicrobiales bacterium]